MKISVIIPNFNGENIIRKNLPKVLDAVRDLNEEVEIIISDDCSTDSSVKFIQDFIMIKIKILKLNLLKTL